MAKCTHLSPLATAIGLCFAVSLGEAATPGLSAARVDGPLRAESARHQRDPFAIPTIAAWAKFASDGELGKEGACGEGKCGDATESAEGKCGEGKCGESMEADEFQGETDPGEGRRGEGQCGEGRCGDTAEPPRGDDEGKCGEGKCGESVKAEAFQGEEEFQGETDPGEGRCGEGKCGN